MPNIDMKFINAAQAAQLKYGVPASVTLAQFGLESGWGKKSMMANNFFGIKFSPVHHKAYVECPTKEFSKERGWYTIVAKFAKFDNADECFEEHARLLAQNPIYADAMAKKYDADQFVREMAKHYATDPRYAEKIIQIMKGDNLYHYDLPPEALNPSADSTAPDTQL